MPSPQPNITIPATLGAMVELLATEKARRQSAQEVVDQHDANEDALEAAILEKLAEQGIEKGSHGGYSFGKSLSTVPQVEDWDAFYKFIARHKYFHLLERRPAAAGCRELFESKGSIPGVVPFTKTRLSFRKSA